MLNFQNLFNEDIFKIELATIQMGAEVVNEGNENSVFRGDVVIPGNATPIAYIKDLSVVQLCNEVVAYCLARAVNLPVPDCYLGLADAGTLNLTYAPPIENGDEDRLVFVSLDAKTPNLTFQVGGPNGLVLWDEIKEWRDLGGLYAYDSWVANTDRHPGNILFGGKGRKSELWLIDHGHCFTGSDWKIGQLDPDGEYINRLTEWLTIDLNEGQKEKHAQTVQKFGDSIMGFDAVAAMKCGNMTDFLPAPLVNALAEFLTERAGNVTRLAHKALGVDRLL